MEKLMRFLCSTIFSIIVALGIPQMARAAEVAINETNFPDAIFRDYVTSEFDKDSNGKLSEEEIARVMYITVNKKGIKNLKGIEYFTALKDLDCDNNQLTDLDVSKNITLRYLGCENNNLIELDLKKNTNLNHLNARFNNLRKLNVTENDALRILNLANNDLTELNLSNNMMLGSKP